MYRYRMVPVLSYLGTGTVPLVHVRRMPWKYFNCVERPGPKALSTFSYCTEFPPHRGFDLCLELGALTK